MSLFRFLFIVGKIIVVSMGVKNGRLLKIQKSVVMEEVLYTAKEALKSSINEFMITVLQAA